MTSLSSLSTLTISLHGRLTAEQLRERLATVDAALQRAESRAPLAGLVVSATAMTGYDRDARELFVEWNGANRHRLLGVAIVTDNPMYRVVIGAMAIASRQHMGAFSSMADAAAWLARLAAPALDARARG